MRTSLQTSKKEKEAAQIKSLNKSQIKMKKDAISEENMLTLPDNQNDNILTKDAFRLGI